jgi:hypothetical protein
MLETSLQLVHLQILIQSLDVQGLELAPSIGPSRIGIFT